MVDIEADGPIPGDFSMVCFGAVVVVEPGLERTFYGELRPISERFIPEALAVSGFTRGNTLAFPEPVGVMRSFGEWRAEGSVGQRIFISNNNGFDWQSLATTTTTSAASWWIAAHSPTPSSKTAEPPRTILRSPSEVPTIDQSGIPGEYEIANGLNRYVKFFH